jgi:AraC-like DNA-binding protein
MEGPVKNMDRVDDFTFYPSFPSNSPAMPSTRGDLEFVFQPEVQRIFDHLAALHGIRIAFFAPDGAELKVGQARGNCAYCRRLRGELGFEETCRALDRRRFAEAAAKRRLVTYECHGGMTEAVLPVSMEERLLGFVMIGQFRTRAKPPASLRTQLRSGSAARQRAFIRDFASTPEVPPEKLPHLFQLLEILVRFIVERRLIDIQDAFAPLLARLREHPEERLDLSHAAALAGCSAVTLSRQFKQQLGRSYREIRRELLLAKADLLLAQSPSLRISEVAYRLGFDDPLYFSRLFRRHRGCSPRAARRTKSSHRL